MAKARIQEILPESASLDDGLLSIGECQVEQLADSFGTPLYVYDEGTLNLAAARVLAAFDLLGARVSFAAKACATPGVLRVFQAAGLGLDVVSGGELEAGLRAGFSPSSIHLHGNCKSPDELNVAARLGIHAVVVDNLEELHVLESAGRLRGAGTRVMLRISLALEAETHPHLQTSGRRSKFGFIRGSDEERRALEHLGKSDELRLIGIHAHLGSQIEDVTIYQRAAEELTELATTLVSAGFPCEEVSIGGGWAVSYRPGDAVLEPEVVAHAVEPAFGEHENLRLAVEPGRALVARAGVALYRVGSVKRAGERRIVAVDGGMGDNPRPALYGAPYTALVNGRAGIEPIGPADLVGRFCESGDVLVRDTALPEVRRGDVICVPVSGAYQLSMASAYNLVPAPAVIMVSKGQARLLTRRATIDDLLAREV